MFRKRSGENSLPVDCLPKAPPFTQTGFQINKDYKQLNYYRFQSCFSNSMLITLLFDLIKLINLTPYNIQSNEHLELIKNNKVSVR